MVELKLRLNSVSEDAATAGMVKVLYSLSEPSTGPSSDMGVLPHLMSPEEMNDISTIVRIDESENQCTKESGQLDVRPADDLAVPGPSGRFDPAPATSAEFGLDVSRALIFDIEHDVGDTAQGIGET